MRSLPIQCGTVRIASVGGERRDIPVSGRAKARLLWLFRNFYILDFPVLSKKQQLLVAQVWNTASTAGSTVAAKASAGSTGTASADAASKEVVATKVRSVDATTEDVSLDLGSQDLIGTIEGYLPKLYPASLPAKEFHVGDRVKAPAPRPSCLRIHLSGGLRFPAPWTAMRVLLLGGAAALGITVLGLTTAGPRLQSMPPPPVAAVVPARPVQATPPALAKPSPEAPPPTVAKASKPAAGAPIAEPHPLPNAMASNASAPELTLPPPQLAPRARALAAPPATPRAHPRATPEVMIRVSVDSDGHAQAFQVLQGDRKRIRSALGAARRFSFQPCDSAADCDHLLKFTDYGDASMVQKID